MKVIILLFVMFLLTACTIGPEYVAPKIDAPSQFVYQDVFDLLNEGKKDNTNINQWWEGFSDEGLTSMVKKAIENNNQIIGATARVRAAKANIALIDADDALTANASFDQSLNANKAIENNNSSSKETSYAIGIDLALPIDVFGKNKREVQAAIAAYETAQAELADTVLRVSTDVAREYLRYRGNQRQLQLLKESVALQEKTLSIVKARYKAGLSPELDMRRAETSVERLRADIPPLLQSLSNSRHTIANFVGDYPRLQIMELDNSLDIPGYEYKLQTEIPINILRRRPDILASEAKLKQSVAEIGIAEADFYPTFNLLSSLQVSTDGLIGNTSFDLFSLAISLLVNQFITDGGARDARLVIAKANSDEALANYKQALLDAALDVETNLIALKSSIERQQSLEKAVVSSSRSFEQADRLYQLGLSSFLDVVDAQRVLASAEQQLATERTNYSTQIASLFRVLGTKVKK